MKREIDRLPKAPFLSKEVIDLLSELCFRKDDRIQPVDMLFVFSSPTEIFVLQQLVKNLLLQDITSLVFITGGKPQYEDYAAKGITQAESELFMNSFASSRFPTVRFYTENISQNTLENVTEALKVYDFSSVKKLLFIFKSHAAGRGYLTLQKFLPETQLLQKTYPKAVFNDIYHTLEKDNWYYFEEGRNRVWGEFLRIKTYGERGDIAYGPEIREKIEKIFSLT